MTRFLWSLAFAVSSSGAVAGQGEIEIIHDPIACWPVDQFLLLRSAFVPPGDVQTAKFYFRATEELDYYYVELTPGADPGAIAPKAAPTTVSVTYYIELVTRSFNSFRSEERQVPVASGDECQRRDPEAAFYAGQNPDIAIGATRIGATPLPPGFQADGISRFMNALGIAGDVGGGGGISGKTIGILAGVGGAAAGALAFVGGGGSDPATTTSPLGGATSSVLSTSTSTAIGGGSSSTTTTAGGGGSTSSTTTTVGGGSTTTVSGSTTTVVGSSSTTTVLGSSTTTVLTTSPTTSTPTTSVSTTSPTSSVPTSSVSTTSPTSSVPTSSVSTTSPTSSVPTSSVSTSAPTTSVTTSVPSSTTTSAGGSGADLQVTKSGSPGTVQLNDRITYTVTVTNRGPARATAVVASDTLPPGVRMLSTSPSCSGSTTLNCSLTSIDVGERKTLTIVVIYDTRQNGPLVNRVNAFGRELDPVPGNNSATASTGVRLRTSEPDAERPILSYQSELTVEGPGRGLTGMVVLNNGQVQQIGTGSPAVFRATAQAGTNRFEAYLEPGAAARGQWRFDFRGSDRTVPGSLKIESGRPVLVEDRSVTFALDGDVRIRFTVELQ